MMLSSVQRDPPTNVDGTFESVDITPYEVEMAT